MDVKKILVPTDFSANAEEAVGAARSIAERFGASIDLVHVYEALPLGMPEWMVLGEDGLPVAARAVQEKLAKQEMDKLLGRLRATGMTVHGRLEEGRAWKCIATLAERERYDLIVMSTHGYTGIERVVMGGVTDKVVRHAPCPVLVVRAAHAR